MDLLTAAAGAAVALVVTSAYNLAATAIRRRVTVRSPEAQAIEQIRPAVNALLETNSPMMQGIIAILEAQKGQCNGNVDEALHVNREAKKRFDTFLVQSARIEEP